MSNSSKPGRDLFISYASEDRELIAKPLAELLTALGVSVWFDQFDLKIGDGLRRKIDEGLSICRYGAVILSPSFFGKHYTNRELDGLAQKEIDGKKVILPIWVGVDEREVRQYSPPLADRIAGRWEEGLASIVLRIIEVVRPDVIESFKKKQMVKLPQLFSGQDIVDIVIGCHFSYSHHDEPKNEEEIDLVGGFIQNLRDWNDIWDEIEIPDQMRATLQITGMINELKDAGWSVYGCRMKGKRTFSGVEGVWVWYTIAVLRGEPEEVIFMDNKVFVYKSEKAT